MEEKIKRMFCSHCGAMFEAPEEPNPQFCSMRCKKNYFNLIAPPDRIDQFYHKITPEDFILCQRAFTLFYVIAFSLTNRGLPHLVVVKDDDVELFYEYYDLESGVLHSFREWPSNWIWRPAPFPDQPLVDSGLKQGQIKPD